MIKKWRKMSQNLEQKSPFACLSLINTGNYTAGRWRNKSQGRWWRERLCEKKKHLPALRWGTRKIKDGKKNWILQSLPFLLCLVRRGGEACQIYAPSLCNWPVFCYCPSAATLRCYLSPSDEPFAHTAVRQAAARRALLHRGTKHTSDCTAEHTRHSDCTGGGRG